MTNGPTANRLQNTLYDMNERDSLTILVSKQIQKAFRKLYEAWLGVGDRSPFPRLLFRAKCRVYSHGYDASFWCIWPRIVVRTIWIRTFSPLRTFLWNKHVNIALMLGRLITLYICRTCIALQVGQKLDCCLPIHYYSRFRPLRLVVLSLHSIPTCAGH